MRPICYHGDKPEGAWFYKQCRRLAIWTVHLNPGIAYYCNLHRPTELPPRATIEPWRPR